MKGCRCLADGRTGAMTPSRPRRARSSRIPGSSNAPVPFERWMPGTEIASAPSALRVPLLLAAVSTIQSQPSDGRLSKSQVRGTQLPGDRVTGGLVDQAELIVGELVQQLLVVDEMGLGEVQEAQCAPRGLFDRPSRLCAIAGCRRASSRRTASWDPYLSLTILAPAPAITGLSPAVLGRLQFPNKG